MSLPLTCAYVIERKKRNCKMKVHPGFQFCAQHLDNVQDLARRRIPCPLDSKHNCFEDSLEKHLWKCNAREKPQPAYYTKGINCDVADSIQDKIPLKDISDSTLICIMDKINNAFSGSMEPSSNDTNASLTILEDELHTEKFGPSVLKHLKQNASLLGILKKYNLLEDNTCFIEFGAGRGKLSHWLIQSSKHHCTNNSFVLVDKAGPRHKLDNKYKDDVEINITRLKIDIEHLNLGLIGPAITSRQIVAVSKHLCGAATDLTFQCLQNFCSSQTDLHSATQTISNTVKGILVAFCCHHQCTWTSYVGKHSMQKWGFDEADFNILTRMSSWATCGSKSSVSQDNIRYQKLGLPSHQQREELGMKCKTLINYGRMLFLQEQNFDCKLFYYTDKKTSLENVAVLAIRTK